MKLSKRSTFILVAIAISFPASLQATEELATAANPNVPFLLHQRVLTSELDNFPSVKDASTVYQAKATCLFSKVLHVWIANSLRFCDVK